MKISDDVWLRIQAVAARQDWVMTAAQLSECGVDRNKARRMARAGHWVHLARGSYWVGRHSGGPSLHARVRAVLLGCGPQVVAAGPTAARLHGIQGLPKDDGTLHLAAPNGHEVRSRKAIHVRRTTVLPSDCMLIRGIPLTNPARTCADLLLELPREEAVSVLDSALNQGLLSQSDRQLVLAHLSGRKGARRARTWLDLAVDRAESPLETRLRLACLDGGLPPPVLQWPIRDPDSGQQFRIDLGWPSQLVGLEADGISVHASPAALYQDRHRQNRLAALVPGLKLFRCTWADTYTPDTILNTLRHALQGPMIPTTVTQGAYSVA